MVLPYVFGGLLVAVALPAGPFLARLAGPTSPAVRVRVPGTVAGALRAAAAVAAVAVSVGETGGDLVVVAALAAVAVGARAPGAALCLAAIAAVGGLRVGSSSLADVTGAHTVVGPALLSPEWDVAIPAALALAGGVVALGALIPPAVAWRDFVASPSALADALAPVVAALVVLAVTVGAPISDAPDDVVWAAVRSALLAGSLPVVALTRRLVTVGDRALEAAAVGLAGAGLVVALAAAA